MTRRFGSLAAVVTALLLVAAAVAADVTDPKVKITKADQARATASLLSGADLGPAWTGKVEKAVSLKFPVCPAYTPNNSDLTITGHAESVVSLASEGLQVDTDVEIFKTAKQVDTLFKRLLQPKLAACLKYDLLKSVGGTNVTIGSVKRLRVAKVGTHAALFRVALAVKSGTSTAGVDSDFLFVGRHRTDYFVNLVFPQPLERQIVALENRIARMLAARAKV